MTYRKIRSLRRYPHPTSGAKGDDIVDGYDLAVDVWGERCESANSGLIAMTYLFRRFGPPALRGDTHKNLCEYVLTTQDPAVFLTLSPSGSSLGFAVGYLAKPEIREESQRSYMVWEDTAWTIWCANRHESEHNGNAYWTARFKGWPRDAPDEIAAIKAIAGPFPRPPQAYKWRTEGTAVQRRVNAALEGTMRSLLRPVRVGDVHFSILGRAERTGPSHSHWRRKLRGEDP